MKPGYSIVIYTGSSTKGRKIRDLIFLEAKKEGVSVSRLCLEFIKEGADGPFKKALMELMEG